VDLLTSDGFAEVSWFDHRTGQDVYGERVMITALGAVGPEPGAPFGFSAPRPNPFHDHVQLVVSLAIRSPVAVEIFDPLGRRVRTLSPGSLDPGSHAIVWDGTSDQGIVQPTGMYLVRVRVGSREQHAEMVRLR